MENPKTAVIIGAGPAGLTAAYELASRTNIKPIVFEQKAYLGGISSTIKHKGNRIDLGGHRFFTKSDRVLDWWFMHMPVDSNQKDLKLTYRKSHKVIKKLITGTGENTFLIKSRKSRIYYNNELFDYPLSLNLKTLNQLGLKKITKTILTYSYIKVLPRKENTLEDFFINRFGYELYETFFKSYTEKVWGKSCRDISPEWGAQRVKGLSLWKAVLDHFYKGKETSLIEFFLYPKKGPGHFWEIVAQNAAKLDTKIKYKSNVVSIKKLKNHQYLVKYNQGTLIKTIKADYVFSSMPIAKLIESLENKVPINIQKIAKKLEYRDFIIVGLLIEKRLKKFDDNWIYIHNPSVKVGRIQFFNNWSPFMVKDSDKEWVGMEYFCNTSDNFWQKNDKEIANTAQKELKNLKIINSEKILETKVVRVKKAYPAYTGSYKQFDKIVDYLSANHPNLYPIGRNGMHKYNNQDHSMLTAMVSVDNIISNKLDKSNIWSINTEEDYHESN